MQQNDSRISNNIFKKPLATLFKALKKILKEKNHWDGLSVLKELYKVKNLGTFPKMIILAKKCHVFTLLAVSWEIGIKKRRKKIPDSQEK